MIITFGRVMNPNNTHLNHFKLELNPHFYRTDTLEVKYSTVPYVILQNCTTYPKPIVVLYSNPDTTIFHHELSNKLVNLTNHSKLSPTKNTSSINIPKGNDEENEIRKFKRLARTESVNRSNYSPNEVQVTERAQSKERPFPIATITVALMNSRKCHWDY